MVDILVILITIAIRSKNVHRIAQKLIQGTDNFGLFQSYSFSEALHCSEKAI